MSSTASTTKMDLPTRASIRYVPRRGYVAADYKVAFIPSATGTKRLQHLSPSSPGYVTWKFPHECISIAQPKTPPRVQSSPSTSRKTTLNSTIARKRNSSPLASAPTASTDSARIGADEMTPDSSVAQASGTYVGATVETGSRANTATNRAPKYVYS